MNIYATILASATAALWPKGRDHDRTYRVASVHASVVGGNMHVDQTTTTTTTTTMTVCGVQDHRAGLTEACIIILAATATTVRFSAQLGSNTLQERTL